MNRVVAGVRVKDLLDRYHHSICIYSRPLLEQELTALVVAAYDQPEPRPQAPAVTDMLRKIAERASSDDTFIVSIPVPDWTAGNESPAGCA